LEYSRLIPTETNLLRLTFANPRGDASHIGPYSRVIFEGSLLKDDDHHNVAIHRDHRWELPNGQRYSRLECYNPCVVSFEAPKGRNSKEIGPFSTFSLMDGVAYGDQRIVAFCDAQADDWYSLDFGQHWPCMIVVPFRR